MPGMVKLRSSPTCSWVGDVDDQEVAGIVGDVTAAGGQAGHVGESVVDQHAAELAHVAAVGLALVGEQGAGQRRHGRVAQVDRDEVAEVLEDGPFRRSRGTRWSARTPAVPVLLTSRSDRNR